MSARQLGLLDVPRNCAFCFSRPPATAAQWWWTPGVCEECAQFGSKDSMKPGPIDDGRLHSLVRGNEVLVLPGALLGDGLGTVDFSSSVDFWRAIRTLERALAWLLFHNAHEFYGRRGEAIRQRLADLLRGRKPEWDHRPEWPRSAAVLPKKAVKVSRRRGK